jgi:hypothetical protein
MTPNEAAALTPEAYAAFVAFANKQIRAQNRAARKRR